MSEQRSRYEYDLLMLCNRIHGAYTGSGEGIPDEEAQRWRRWLTWRLDEGWDTHAGETWRGHEAYDNAVRALCRVALGELIWYMSDLPGGPR